MALGVSRFPDAGERRLEQGVPDSKAILSVDWQREKFSALLRATNYGKAADASADFELDSQLILDLSIAYQATPRVALALGANNLLDSLPDTLDEQSGTAFDQIYPFSRFSPYGMSGRFLFLRMHATLE